MNICFYTDQAISGMTGGIGRMTSVMTEFFRKKYGWKVFSIFAFDAKKECILTETDGAIKLRLHDRLNIRPDVLHNVNKAVQFIIQNHIDVVFIQTSLDVVKKLRKALDKANQPHIKIITELHFTPGKDEWPWQKGGLKGMLAPMRNQMIHHATRSAYRNAYKYADRVYVLSNGYLKGYQDYAGLKESQKLAAMPNCLSFSETYDTRQIAEKQHEVIVVARMEELSKRITLMLKIWQQVEQSGQAKDWTFKLVGDGPHLPMYKQMAQDLQLKQVSFEGRQNPIPYYKNASIFLMTSAFEGFPMTLIEAQQFGTVPVVFNSFETLSDVVCHERNGLIVPDGNLEMFTQQLLRLIGNQEMREEMAKNAAHDCQRFSQESICQNWKEQIENIVK